MKKDLVIKKDTPLSIVKTKALLDLTQKILGESEDESGWAERLWAWADEYHISDKRIPRDLMGLTQLTKLYLLRQQLVEIPKEIWFLTQLIPLDLSKNQLVELPKGIERLTQLGSLNLSYNQLTELPKEIGRLTQLTSLDCTRTSLWRYPKRFVAYRSSQSFG